MQPDKRVTYENISYGISLKCYDKDMHGYYEGVKVHFFNKKGVLVGNSYEFVPYNRLEFRQPHNNKDRTYIRFFYKKKFEKIRTGLFITVLKITSLLIRFTQKHMDGY